LASAVGPRVNLAGAIAAVLAGAVTLACVGIILVQGEEDVGRVVLVASTIAGAAIASWAGSVADHTRARSSLLGAAAGALLGLGLLTA
jgi:Ca2+/Na+ antiporter